MPGMPLQVICYERADDIAFGVSGVVTRARGIRATLPNLDPTEIPLHRPVHAVGGRTGDGLRAGAGMARDAGGCTAPRRRSRGRGAADRPGNRPSGQWVCPHRRGVGQHQCPDRFGRGRGMDDGGPIGGRRHRAAQGGEAFHEGEPRTGLREATARELGRCRGESGRAGPGRVPARGPDGTGGHGPRRVDAGETGDLRPRRPAPHQSADGRIVLPGEDFSTGWSASGRRPSSSR